MTVLRIAAAYEVVGDALVQEIPLPISVEALRGILHAKKDDPEFFDPYPLNRDQFAALGALVPEVATQAFEPYEWFCECFASPTP
jgi:hypothetical protein